VLLQFSDALPPPFAFSPFDHIPLLYFVDVEHTANLGETNVQFTFMLTNISPVEATC